ncbi:TIGR04086 family membrane protein [Oceanobacillus halotolerans]|uniref:TIGR04086 family membrane protein n=1 Tax=Oceanobacillus halotolerans TaxID=2663380 RepID=UPI0013DB0554|nr:TIGR04086 family membrane protein [Oceanobacillus halotolerans]
MRQQQIVAVLYGWIVVLGLILITSVLLAFVLRFMTMTEGTLAWVTLAVGLISLFIGGIIAGAKGKQKGWIIGTLTGLGFTLFTFLVQYLGYQQTFSLEQSLHHVGYVLAALIGGVIGVNLAGSEEQNT